MSSAGVVLAKRILARHGARRDLRLWRNETAGAWTGKRVGTNSEGHALIKHARMIQAGLCNGSADLIGIREHEIDVGPHSIYIGQFVALEIKAPGDRISEEQLRFLEVVQALGGIGEVVESVEDVDRILGEPPK